MFYQINTYKFKNGKLSGFFKTTVYLSGLMMLINLISLSFLNLIFDKNKHAKKNQVFLIFTWY